LVRRIGRSDEIPIQINIGKVLLEGSLTIPGGATGVVVFAHGSGSSRFSPRNTFVARELHRSGLATLLFDLLTRQEEELDTQTGQLRFDIGLLAKRLTGATDWLKREPAAKRLVIGYFGASTGAAAALVAAAERPGIIGAVVSRGGRPDLAAESLAKVRAPTLLIVGGDDDVVIAINREALGKLAAKKALVIVPGATHLFEEPGALEEVARLSAAWFEANLKRLG
jgi:putative phosphoribosyl transferase